MNVITPEQSAKIQREIFEQAMELSGRADAYAPPWGTANRVRINQLYRKRMNAAFPWTMESEPCG